MQSEPRNARVSVWPLSVSLAATPEIDVSFSSSGYLDVSVPRVPFLTLWIGVRITGVFPVRFPHSDIHGSQVICTSPWLFAAYHVFRRLLVPRHPPCALLCLTSRCIALQHFVLLKKAFLSFYWIFGLLILGCLDIWNFHFFLSILYLYEIFKVLLNLHYLAKIQWRRRDSNSWPPACKAGALPTELRPRCNLAATYFPILLPV